MIPLWLIALSAVGVFIGYKLLSHWREGRRIDAALGSKVPLPRAVWRVPFIGTVLDMLLTDISPWEVLCGWNNKYGPVIQFHFFGYHYLSISDPEMIRHVLQKRISNYQKDKEAFKPFKDLLGTGLVTAEGELWERQRRLISSAFRVDILDETVEIAQAAAGRLVHKLRAAINESDNGAPAIDISEEFRKLTLQVIAEALVSMSAEESDKVFPDLYLPIVTEANKRTFFPFRAYLPLPSTFKYNKAVRELNAYVTNIIRNRMKLRKSEDTNSERRRDILDRLLNGVGQERWDDDAVILQLRDEIKTFLLAGHETSSMMLSWTLYELVKNPHCMEKVLDEANSVLSRENVANGLTKVDQVKGLEYTYNALREALRKYAIVPVITREAINDDKIGEYDIPRGVRIAIPIINVHRNPEYWPEPTVYKPERWNDPIKHPFAWLGFINGPRNCIGQHFALLEAKIVLATLVKTFSFAQPKGSKEVTKDPYIIPACPSSGMDLVVTAK